MWLFTNFGFFSIVCKGDDDELTVRSRTLGDLLRLQRHYLPQLTDPVSGAGSDYPWRARCTRDELSEAMPRIAQHINYADFEDEVAHSLGKDRAHRYSKVWSALYGGQEDLAEPVRQGWDGLPWAEKPTAGKQRAYGGVVVDPTGRLLLREVEGHYDGYVWTFAKGLPKPGESPRQTALREVYEEMGAKARILLPMPGTYTGTTTRSHFFLMTVDPKTVVMTYRSRETRGLQWVVPKEARELIEQTKNPTGRKRDLKLLDAVTASLPSPLPLKRPIARREDWTTRAMPASRVKLPFERSLSQEEMAHVARGFIPSMMEEKWFSYFEDGVLRFHRSWTGIEIFRVQCVPLLGPSGAWQLADVQVNRHSGQYMEVDAAADQSKLRDLIDNLLISWGEEPTVDPFAAALELASGPNYLGSPAVVGALIARFFDAMMKTFAGNARLKEVVAASSEIVGAMTDDPAYTRMTWHSREQLGASLIVLMGFRADDYNGKDLALIVADSLGAVYTAAKRMAHEIEAERQAEWNAHGLQQFNELASFVITAFLGTTSLAYPGKTLADFVPKHLGA